MSWDVFRNEMVGMLQGVPFLTCEAMPDGHGLRSSNVFFGIIQKGRMYFRVDDSTRPAYEEMGSGPFRVKGGVLEAYYEVPFDIRDEKHLLLQWATQAIAVARRAPTA